MFMDHSLSPASACVRMLDWFEHEGHICIVFELLGLSTFEFLQQNKFLPFNVEQIRHMAFQIFRAVACESTANCVLATFYQPCDLWPLTLSLLVTFHGGDLGFGFSFLVCHHSLINSNWNVWGTSSYNEVQLSLHHHGKNNPKYSTFHSRSIQTQASAETHGFY